MEAIVRQPASVDAVETERTATCQYSVLGYNDLEDRWVMLEWDTDSAHQRPVHFISSEHLTNNSSLIYCCDVMCPTLTWPQRRMSVGHNGTIGIVLNQDLNYYFSVHPIPTSVSSGVVSRLATGTRSFKNLTFSEHNSDRAISYSTTYGWIIEMMVTVPHSHNKFHCLFGIRPSDTVGGEVTPKYIVGFRYKMFKFCFMMINGVDFVFRDNWDGDLDETFNLTEKRKHPYCIHLMNVELQKTRRYEYSGKDFGDYFDAQSNEVFEKFDVYYQQIVLVTRRNFPGYKYKYHVYKVVFDEPRKKFHLTLFTIVPFGSRYTANLLNIHFSQHCKKFVTVFKFFSSADRLMTFYSFEANDNPETSVTTVLCSRNVLNVAMPHSVLTSDTPTHNAFNNSSS